MSDELLTKIENIAKIDLKYETTKNNLICS